MFFDFELECVDCAARDVGWIGYDAGKLGF